MMSKTPKSIFKMQDAGNVPEVNQYGLTEEQMKSVRDYMRRYGLSEEEAVANKIDAMNASREMVNTMMSELNGPIGDVYRNMHQQLTPTQAIEYKTRLGDNMNKINNTVNSFYNSTEYDPNWRIRINQGINELQRSINYETGANNAFFNWITSNDKTNLDPRVKNIVSTMVSGNQRNYRDYEKYKQEYLDSHQVNTDIWDYFPDNYNNVSYNTNPIISRNQDAHDYALSKLQQDWKHDKELATFFPNSDYFQQKVNENSYFPNFQSPSNQFKTGVKQGTAIGTAAGAMLAAPFLFAPEFAGGALSGTLRTVGGFVGSAIGSKVLGDIGKWGDSHFNYNNMASFYGKSNLPGAQNKAQLFRWLGTKKSPLKSVGDFIGGLIGWGKGANFGNDLAKTGWASIMNKPWARKLPQWVVSNSLKEDTFNMLLKNNLIQPRWKTTFVNDYSFLPGNNPNTLLLPARTGAVIKRQSGGLIYKPYLSEQNESNQTSSTTLSYEPEDSDDELFQVEPVKIYNPPTSIVQEHTEEPIQEQKTEELVYIPQSEFTDKEMSVLYEDGTNEEKRKVAIKYLQQNLSLTKEQAAAIVGQWQRESNFKLNAENKEEKAGKNNAVKSSQYGIGIGQWTGSRHDAFVKYINSHGGVANLKTQLDFAISEIKNNPDFLNNLRKASTIEDASAYVYVQYIAAQYKGIKNTDDLYSKVKTISANYRKKHQQMYGHSSDTFGIGLRNAIDSLNLLG